MNNMLPSLVKVRLLAIFTTIFMARKSEKKKSKFSLAGMLLLGLFVIVSLGFSFGSMFYIMCEPLCSSGLSWLYFSIAGIICFALMFIGSIFMTQSQIFNATDNELLLSMPIPPRYILASRMISLLLYNLIYGMMIIVPAGIVYCFTQPITFFGVCIYILTFIFTNLAALALSFIIAYLISLITSRMRNKNIFTIIFSLAFLGAYFFFYSKIYNYIEMLITNGTQIAEAIKKGFVPLYWYGVSIVDSNFLFFLLYSLCAVVPFILIYAIISASFIRLITTKRGAARIEYKESKVKPQSVMTALIKREISHLLSSAGYMMNAALGIILLIVAAVALIIKRDLLTMIIAEQPELSSILAPIICLALCFLTTMSYITAPSISIEGKNFWILRVIPIKTETVLLSKLAFHMWLTEPPVIFAAIIFCIASKSSPLMCVLMFAAPTVFNLLNGVIGILANLRFPKLDYLNEMIAVKQGIPTIIVMLSTWGLALVPPLLYGFLLSQVLSAELFALLSTVLYAVLCALLFRVLMTKGVKKFESI